MKNMENGWQIYRTRFLVKARQLSRRAGFRDALGREHRGNKGDYLVESDDGTRRIVPRAFFEDVYVTMDTAGGGSLPISLAPPELNASRVNSFVEKRRLGQASRSLIS